MWETVFAAHEACEVTLAKRPRVLTALTVARKGVRA